MAQRARSVLGYFVNPLMLTVNFDFSYRRLRRAHPSRTHVCSRVGNQHFTAVFTEDTQHVLLAAAPEARRATLIATKESDTRFRWTLRLQGPHETVFFEYE
jgi:hypothetical protein